jgi:hypothetical protein
MNAWWLFRKSAFAHLVGRGLQNAAPLLRGRQRPAAIQPEATTAATLDVFDRSARKMIERIALITRQEGIPTLFMLQPILALERERLPRMPEIERQLFEFNLSAWPDGNEAYMRAVTPLLARRVDSTATALGAEFLDLTGIYRDVTTQIFTDYAHLTPEGNQRLAAFIAPTVERLVRRRSSARQPAAGRSSAAALP